jgi:hypothetical protein
MTRRPVDTTSLVAGLATMAFGGLLLLHSVDAIDLSLAYLAPAVFAIAGAILLASGLSRSRRG